MIANVSLRASASIAILAWLIVPFGWAQTPGQWKNSDFDQTNGPQHDYGTMGHGHSPLGQNSMGAVQPNVGHNPAIRNTNIDANSVSNAMSGNAQLAVEAAFVVRLAREHNRYALDLARRGAFFSAEEEYFKSLWIVARKLDERYATAAHSASLNAARCAFAETKDFLSLLPDKWDHDVRRLVLAHETPILRGSPNPIPALSAMRAYYAYARDQLILAGGGEATASTSLSGMAKIQLTLRTGPQKSTTPAKAIALFEAAIAVNPNNALAANELGVLLAKYGRFEAARNTFEQSIRSQQHVNTWKNLAKTYDILGQDQMAARARENLRNLESISRTQDRSPARAVWVDAATFAGQSRFAAGDVSSNNAGAESRRKKEVPEENRMSRGTTDSSATQKKKSSLQRILDVFRKEK